MQKYFKFLNTLNIFKHQKDHIIGQFTQLISYHSFYNGLLKLIQIQCQINLLNSLVLVKSVRHLFIECFQGNILQIHI